MRNLSKLFVVVVLVALVAAACAPAAPTAAPVVEEPVATEAPVVETPSICGEIQPGDTLNVMYQWSGAEEEMINAIFKPLVDQSGLTIVADSTRDAAVLDTKAKSTPPDILF